MVRPSGPFDVLWTKSPQEKRRSTLLKAMVTTATIGPPIELHRGHCREATLDHLDAENGQAFLDLIGMVFPPDSDRLDPAAEPVLFADPDPNNQYAGDAALQRFHLVRRSIYLSHVMHYTVRLFYDLPTRIPEFIKTQSYKDIAKLDVKRLKDSGASQADVKATRERNAQGYQGLSWACSSIACGKRIPEGRPQMVCAACNKISRKVVYCSRSGCLCYPSRPLTWNR